MDTKWPMPMRTSFEDEPTMAKKTNVYILQFVLISLLLIFFRPSFVMSQKTELEMARINLLAVLCISLASIGAAVCATRFNVI